MNSRLRKKKEVISIKCRSVMFNLGTKQLENVSVTRHLNLYFVNKVSLQALYALKLLFNSKNQNYMKQRH